MTLPAFWASRGNQLIFDLGQMDILSLYLYQPAFKVNEKIAYFIFKTLGAGCSGCGAARCGCGPAAQPCQRVW